MARMTRGVRFRSEARRAAETIMAIADRQRDDHEDDAEEDQLLRRVRVSGRHELRQKGHEEHDDLRVQQVHAEAHQPGAVERLAGGRGFVASMFSAEPWRIAWTASHRR